MKTAAFFLALLTGSTALADQDIAGRYTGPGLTIDIQPRDGGYAARAVTTSGECEGELVGTVTHTPGSKYFAITAKTPDGETCTVDVGPLSGPIGVEQSVGCTYFHGAKCAFFGTVKRAGSARDVPATPSTDYEYTYFESQPAGARVVINGEYIGKTPFRKNIKELVSVPGLVVVKALPAGKGCVQVEAIKNQRPPRRMFFDMAVCPIPGALDITIN
jgi:hypothetical protein